MIDMWVWIWLGFLLFCVIFQKQIINYLGHILMTISEIKWHIRFVDPITPFLMVQTLKNNGNLTRYPRKGELCFGLSKLAHFWKTAIGEDDVYSMYGSGVFAYYAGLFSVQGVYYLMDPITFFFFNWYVNSIWEKLPTHMLYRQLNWDVIQKMVVAKNRLEKEKINA